MSQFKNDVLFSRGKPNVTRAFLGLSTLDFSSVRSGHPIVVVVWWSDSCWFVFVSVWCVTCGSWPFVYFGSICSDQSPSTIPTFPLRWARPGAAILLSPFLRSRPGEAIWVLSFQFVSWDYGTSDFIWFVSDWSRVLRLFPFSLWFWPLELFDFIQPSDWRINIEGSFSFGSVLIGLASESGELLSKSWPSVCIQWNFSIWIDLIFFCYTSAWSAIHVMIHLDGSWILNLRPRFV